jgi:hypothetical protein
VLREVLLEQGLNPRIVNVAELGLGALNGGGVLAAGKPGHGE